MKTCSGTAKRPVKSAEQQHDRHAAPEAEPLPTFADARQVGETAVGVPDADGVAAAGDADDDEAGEHADDADAQQAEVDAALGDDAADDATDGDADADQPRHVAGVGVSDLEFDFPQGVDRRGDQPGEQPENARDQQRRERAVDRRRASVACPAEP